LSAAYRQSDQSHVEIDWLTGQAWSDRAAISDWSVPMLSAHITSFFNLIRAQLEETSRGITSIHHFHNVQCGIDNILCLLEYNNDVFEKADQLARRASSYITRHDSISSKIIDGGVSEDADRLRAAHEALAGFCFAVEHSKPNSRVGTLGLA
jgi:hypothetical protein